LAHRDLPAFASDGIVLAPEVVNAAHGIVRWEHLGDPGPLLAAVTEVGGDLA